MTTELIVNVGILVQCLPFLKPVTEAMEHGFFSSDVRYASGVRRTAGEKSGFTLRSLMSTTGRTTKRQTSTVGMQDQGGENDMPFTGNYASVSSTAKPGSGTFDHDDSERSTSLAIHKQTSTFVETC